MLHQDSSSLPWFLDPQGTTAHVPSRERERQYSLFWPHLRWLCSSELLLIPLRSWSPGCGCGTVLRFGEPGLSGQAGKPATAIQAAAAGHRGGRAELAAFCLHIQALISPLHHIRPLKLLLSFCWTVVRRTDMQGLTSPRMRPVGHHGTSQLHYTTSVTLAGRGTRLKWYW